MVGNTCANGTNKWYWLQTIVTNAEQSRSCLVRVGHARRKPVSKGPMFAAICARASASSVHTQSSVRGGVGHRSGPRLLTTSSSLVFLGCADIIRGSRQRRAPSKCSNLLTGCCVCSGNLVISGRLRFTTKTSRVGQKPWAPQSADREIKQSNCGDAAASTNSADLNLLAYSSIKLRNQLGCVEGGLRIRSGFKTADAHLNDRTATPPPRVERKPGASMGNHKIKSLRETLLAVRIGSCITRAPNSLLRDCARTVKACLYGLN